MSNFYRFLLIGLLSMVCAGNSYAQRNMEYLDRGAVAVRVNANDVLVNWRITGPEYSDDALYNLYRGDTKIASNLTTSNYVDKTSSNASYSVAAVINGVEQKRSDAVTTLTQQYLTIPVRKINGGYAGYNLNDASVGDLDGDGEYEIVVKRLSNDCTPTRTSYHYLEAYKLDGTFMWAIDLGKNMLNPVEINFLVYDLDGDGKAEVATRTCDGTVDALGKGIGNANILHNFALNGSYFRIDGPDFISIFNGETGGEITSDNYIALAPLSQWGPSGLNNSQLGHRATKCMWSVAYLDGKNPSFVITRGIYERIKLEAWNFRNGKLTKEWGFDSSPNGVASAYHGEGFHNFVVGDVNGDGKDEIMYGAMAVGSDGKGMYATGFEHGDAQHLADINPDIAGLEHFTCHEHAGHVNELGVTIPGLALRNATTGKIQWSLPATGDIGRCMAADIDPKYKGMEIWGSAGGGVFSCTGEKISSTLPMSTTGAETYNAGVWWDGDVQRELLDRKVITKWNSTTQSTDRVATLYNMAPVTDNNSTKSNPCLMADILGDWREEVIYRKSDNTGMVVFVTPFSTTQRMYTLMHDKNYRTAISWQQNSYNQPPNLSFYFGDGMDTPPKPNITVIKENTAPSVSLTAPLDKGSSRLGDVVAMSVDATDDKGVAKVVFYVTEKATMSMSAVGEDTDAPYTNNWTPTNTGTYYMVAKATDSDGVTVASNIITYNVTDPIPVKASFTGSVDDLYETAGNWSTGVVPGNIDTAVIAQGEAKLNGDISIPVFVEPAGVFRMIGYWKVPLITLKGGALLVNTSNATYGLDATVAVESASSIIVGANPITIFNADIVFTGNGDLTKTEAGTLELQKSSPNHRGNWNITAGKVVALASNAFGTGVITVSGSSELVLAIAGAADSCDSLIVEDGSKLNLSVSQTVPFLKLGEVYVKAGTYTSADYPEYITGSGSITVLKDVLTSVEIISATISGLKVYPNPVQDNVSIEVRKDGYVYLANSNGVFVKELSIGSNDVSNMPEGVYYIMQKNDNKIIGCEQILITK